MSETKHSIDWESVRSRLAQAKLSDSGSASVDGQRLKAIFKKRAERLAIRGNLAEIPSGTARVLVFRLGAERFGIEISQVEQIFKDVSITPVPAAGRDLRGVANLNGTIRSVIDLGRLLNVRCATGGGSILLIRAPEQTIGLWAEAIEDITRIELSQLEPLDDAASSDARRTARGITKDRIVVLNVEPLFECIFKRLLTNEQANQAVFRRPLDDGIAATRESSEGDSV
jgi:purine-binding chemotaxis protein CheW